MGNLVRPGPLFCLAGLAPQSQGRGAAACDTVASSALFSDGPCPARQVRAVPAGVSAPVADCARPCAAGPGRGRREPGARQPPAAGLCAAAGPQHGVCGALRPRCAWALRGTDCAQRVHCMRSVWMASSHACLGHYSGPLATHVQHVCSSRNIRLSSSKFATCTVHVLHVTNRLRHPQQENCTS